MRSPSAFQKFLDCPEAYRLQYREGYRPSGGIALGIGTAVHALLERYYRARLDGVPLAEDYAADVVAKYEERGAECFTDSETERYRVGLSTLMGVIAAYPGWAGARDNFTVEKVESCEEMEDFTSFRTDLVVRYPDGTRAVWDHKTTTKQYVGAFRTSATFRMQTLAYVGHERADAMVYNFIFKPTIRQGKKETLAGYCERVRDDYVSRPDFYFERSRYVIPAKTARRAALQQLRVAKVAEAAMYAVAPNGPYPRNTEHCVKYGSSSPCPFLPVCRNGIDPKDLFGEESSNE